MLIAPDMPITTTYRVTGHRLPEDHRHIGDYSISLYGNASGGEYTVTSSIYLTEVDALALRKVLNRLIVGQRERAVVRIEDGDIIEEENA